MAGWSGWCDYFLGEVICLAYNKIGIHIRKVRDMVFGMEARMEFRNAINYDKFVRIVMSSGVFFFLYFLLWFHFSFVKYFSLFVPFIIHHSSNYARWQSLIPLKQRPCLQGIMSSCHYISQFSKTFKHCWGRPIFYFCWFRYYFLVSHFISSSTKLV